MQSSKHNVKQKSFWLETLLTEDTLPFSQKSFTSLDPHFIPAAELNYFSYTLITSQLTILCKKIHNFNREVFQEK